MKRIYLICLLLLGFSSGEIAQARTVKGTVTDAATGDPLPPVSVQVKGTTTGTVKDIFAANINMKDIPGEALLLPVSCQ